MADFGTFVTHLECGLTGEKFPKGELHNLSSAGRPLLVFYDLEGIKKSFKKNDLRDRAPDMWRWRELLPVSRSENVVSLGEIVTPLLNCPVLEKKLGSEKSTVFIKDEGRLPTGSFKARGLAMAVSMAKELGVKVIAMPTAGNAGSALSAYATRAGIKSYIFSPEDSQEITVQETLLQGGEIFLVNGLINDCGKIVGDGKGPVGWFDFSTLKEPYRIEGKKTMGLELVEQMNWEMPDAIFYPTGGGTGLIGMWKAFKELEEIEFVTGKFPKMIAVQSEGCAPIVKAFREGKDHADLWENANTIAQGMRVPIAVGDFLILRAVRESGGSAVTVTDQEIESARLEVGASEGLHIGLEGAATYAAYKNALKSGELKKDDKVVLFNCGSGLKYLTDLKAPRLDRTQPIDYSQF